MNTSTIEARRSPGKRLGVFAVALAVVCAGMFGLSTQRAQAADFEMQFDGGLLNLGAAFTGKEILPAPSGELPNWWDIATSTGIPAAGITYFPGACADPEIKEGAIIPAAVPGGPVPATDIPSPSFPCGANPATASIIGEWDYLTRAITLDNTLTGVVNPANPATYGQATGDLRPLNLGFQFPIMIVPSPIDQAPVPITLAATSDITGEYSWPAFEPNPGNGSLTLTPSETDGLESRVLVGLGISDENGGAQPYTYCAVKLPSLTLSTAGSDPAVGGFPAAPFNNGLTGAGAVSGTFTVQGTSVPVKQGVGVVDPATLAEDDPAKAPLEGCASSVDLVTQGNGGVWFGNRTEPPACKEGQIGVYPDCADPKANISKIAVTGKKSVKKGKKVKLTVKVTNKGTADESVTVRLWSSNSGVASVTGSVKVNAPAGGTGSKKVTVKAKKKKGKTTIKATNGARVGKLAVKVK
jgi:hypothetical protein